MNRERARLLHGGHVFVDRFVALRLGVLCQFARQHQGGGGLHFSGAQRAASSVLRALSGLGADALEQVVDEGVEDGHGLLGHAHFGVHLLQHLVDVDVVRLGSLAHDGWRGFDGLNPLKSGWRYLRVVDGSMEFGAESQNGAC